MRESRVPDTYAESLEQGEAASRFRSEVITDLLKEAEDFDRGDRIIDAGCGYGLLLRRLEQAGFSDVLGVGAIPAVASQVKEEGIRVIEGDLEEGLKSLMVPRQTWSSALRCSSFCTIRLLRFGRGEVGWDPPVGSPSLSRTSTDS